MDKHEKKAHELYCNSGYGAVIDAVNDGELEQDRALFFWGLCDPCDSEQPIYKKTCLSCGSFYETKQEEQ